MLAQDFLSPLLTAGLFPDFVQRFIPRIFSLSDALDRARGLEYAFEQAWFNKPWYDPFNVFRVTSEERAKNPLAASYYEHWIPEGKAPALVLNTTVVETGERLLLSPFNFATQSSGFSLLTDISTVACPLAKGGHHIDFPLSTAAVLSARFPIVTPVGWFERCNDKNGNLIDKNGNLIDKDGNPVKGEDGHPRARLADGGYFENSGLSTALTIGKILKNQKSKPELRGVKFKVIYFNSPDSF